MKITKCSIGGCPYRLYQSGSRIGHRSRLASLACFFHALLRGIEFAVCWRDAPFRGC